MRVLVTGGLGFIGRACVPRLLKAGCQVSVLDALEPSVHGFAQEVDRYSLAWGSEAALTVASLGDSEALEQLVRQADAVLHLASLTSVPESMHRRAHFVDENLRQTAILCDLLAKHNTVQRLVLASSRAVYGEGPYRCSNACLATESQVTRDEASLATGQWNPVCPKCGLELIPLPATEATPPHPVSVYGLTKLGQEQLLRMTLPFCDTRMTVLRLQNVYGPGQGEGRPDVGVTNLFVAQALRGETLNLYEDGHQVRDFVFIEDVAELMTAATISDLSTARYCVFNVGTGTGISFRSLASDVYTATGKPPSWSISGQYRIGDVRSIVACTKELRATYPWTPVPLHEGLQRLVEWFRARSLSQGAKTIRPTERSSVLGVAVDHATYGTVLDTVLDLARRRRRGLVAFCNVHMVMTAYWNREFRGMISEFDIIAPDGQPVRWALNRFGNAGLRDRVYGPLSLLKICNEAARLGLNVFLYGSYEDRLEDLRDHLLMQFPGLKIVGIRPSRFRPATNEEDRDDIDEINGSGAQLVFVGMGCPLQETWAYNHRHSIDAVLIGVGGAFDFYSGAVRQAPQWMQARGLEWLFRLTQEPKRLWRRYLLNNTAYLVLVGLQWMGFLQSPDPSRRPSSDH
jgi:exopolysaccharide biosynthesis WecB/TagA/CpsF family protein